MVLWVQILYLSGKALMKSVLSYYVIKFYLIHLVQTLYQTHGPGVQSLSQTPSYPFLWDPSIHLFLEILLAHLPPNHHHLPSPHRLHLQ